MATFSLQIFLEKAPNSNFLHFISVISPEKIMFFSKILTAYIPVSCQNRCQNAKKTQRVFFMRITGLEPARDSPLEPKSAKVVLPIVLRSLQIPDFSCFIGISCSSFNTCFFSIFITFRCQNRCQTSNLYVS